MWVLGMGFVTYRGVKADDDPAMLASIGVRRMLVLVMAVVRLSCGVLGAAVALAGMAPPARPGWVVAGSVLVLGWAVLFTLDVLRHGPRPGLLWIDVLVVVAVVLAHRWLVPAQVRAVNAGTGWVDIIAGTGVLIAQFGIRQPLGLAAGFLITAAYVVGDGQIREAPVHMVAEALLAAGLVTLLRRSASVTRRSCGPPSAPTNATTSVSCTTRPSPR